MLQLVLGGYGENERNLKMIGRVFNACEVVLKQLVIICKVMVLLQTLLGCLTSLSRA